jgi:hypothetical protein
VSLTELDDILLTGRLRQGPNSVEGEYLTGSVQEALCFAGHLYPDGDFRIVEVEVPEAVAGRFFLMPRLDGCGRGWFVELDDLRECIIREVKP